MIKLALRRNGLTREPVVLDDGAPAIAYLRRIAPFENAELPELLILDLNLKTVDGPEVLDFVRSQSSLANIAVAVLSSSPEGMFNRAIQPDCCFEKGDLKAYLEIGRKLLEICHFAAA